MFKSVKPEEDWKDVIREYVIREAIIGFNVYLYDIDNKLFVLGEKMS